MTPERFVGRTRELRTLVHNAEYHHPTLIIANEGHGKTALLQTLHSILNPTSPVLYLERFTPCGTFLPYEITRLVEHHAAEDHVRVAEIHEHTQAFVERDEKGIALAPLLLVVGAAGIALIPD